jgi:hypothetical protein
MLADVGDDEVLALHVPFDTHDFRQHFITKAKAEEIYEEARTDEFSTIITFCVDHFRINYYSDTNDHNIAVLKTLPFKSNLTLEEWKEVVSWYETCELDDYSVSREVMTLSIIQMLLRRSNSGLMTTKTDILETLAKVSDDEVLYYTRTANLI